jgi:hypothetical protein
MPVARQNSDLLLNQGEGTYIRSGLSPCNTALMLRLVRLLPVPVIGFFSSRRDLLLENLALRQQLAVLKTEAFSPSPCCYRQTFLGDITAEPEPLP